ncbi:MAG TPA: hypothetical protein VE959_33335 [Bryobacteraceae bacterium]|nr:hypothetical protein [Bryobacteraceae bacterium]
MCRSTRVFLWSSSGSFTGAVVLTLALAAHAQSSRGTVTGTVSDQ